MEETTKPPLKIMEIPRILNAIMQEEHYIASCEKRMDDIESKLELAHNQINSLQESYENNIKAIDIHNAKFSDLKAALKKLEEHNI